MSLSEFKRNEISYELRGEAQHEREYFRQQAIQEQKCRNGETFMKDGEMRQHCFDEKGFLSSRPYKKECKEI